MSDQTTTSTVDADTITEHVRARYAGAAQRVALGVRAEDDAIPSSSLYAESETATLPAAAVLASLGCGNPTALIELAEGETVLDLGSGGGIDVLLSARRVGESGFVYGLDMTDEMLALALANKEQAGVRNVAFLKGRIEQIPLPAQSVDVVISNCVINLSADKGQVLREAFRVLKPGGRFAVSDVVALSPLSETLRRNLEDWAGCVAGALEIGAYEALLTAAGFEKVGIEIIRHLTAADAGQDVAPSPEAADAEGKVASAFVRATKPLAATLPAARAPEMRRSGCCG